MHIVSLYYVRRLSNRFAARLMGALFLAGGMVASPTPARGFQPNTMRVGSLEIHPRFQTEFTYNNNISLNHNKVSDVVFKQTPGLSLQWGRVHVPVQRPRIGNPYGMPQELLLDLYLLRVHEMGKRGYEGRGRQDLPPGRPLESALLSASRLRKFGFLLKYEPMFINLMDHPEFNSIEQDVSLLVDLRLPSGFYLRLDDYYRTSNTINNFRYEVADFNRALRGSGVGYAVNQAAFTVGYNFYADYLAFITYSNYFFFLDDIDFASLLDDAGLPDFVDLEFHGIDSDKLGFAIHSLGFFLSKPINRRIVLTVGYSIGIVRGNLEDFAVTGSFLDGLVPFSLRVDNDPRDALLQEVRFRFQTVLTESRSVFGMRVPKTTLEGAFWYQIRAFDGTQIEITGPDSPGKTIPLQLEDFNEFFATLRLASKIRPRTHCVLEFKRYPWEEIGGRGYVSINYTFAASVTHQIRTKWLVGARGSFRIRQNLYEKALEPTTFDYRAGLNVAYNLQSWLKASVIYQFLAHDGDMGYNNFDAQRVRLRIRVIF